MPLNKNAYLRYQIIDECLTKRSMKYPSPKILLEEIERILDQRISKETLLKDIRDMKKSSDLGFDAPIKYSRSHNGYYYEDPNYTIKRFPVDYEEKESAEFALALLNQSGSLPYLNRFKNFVERALTFSKVENQLQKDLSRYIQFEEPVTVEGLQWIEPLVDAIQLKHIVEIIYTSIQGKKPKERALHPYLLKEYDDRWYVYGFDERSEEERIFGLDRIQSIETNKQKEYRYLSSSSKCNTKKDLRGARLRSSAKRIIFVFSCKNIPNSAKKIARQIKALLDAGHNQSEVARTIGVHRSTVCRELKRNVANDGSEDKDYCPEAAQQLTDQRHQNKPKYRRFTKQLKDQARRWLAQEKLSPELISGRWQVMGIDGVSHETLYQWIWAAKRTADPTDKNLYRHLKHGRHKRKRGRRTDGRGTIKGRVSITERPDVVEKWQRLGDIEVDLMMGKAHKSALLVLTDRTTLLTGLEKVTSRKAEGIADRITRRLARIPSSFIKTLTFDNDKAFARHQNIADQLEADTYFTRPYTSQDKGTVENRIWVVRRFFPKGTDLRKISRQRIKTVEQYLNFRPIRKFDYLNPTR